MNTQFWFLLACFFVMLEIGHPGLLYFLALAIGSGAAMLASWLQYSATIQYGAFFGGSFVAIGFVHILTKYIVVPDTKFHRSNVDLLLGKIVTIVEVQSSSLGQGRLGGEMWLVKLQGDGELKVGMNVVVIAVQGCHLQVHISEQIIK